MTKNDLTWTPESTLSHAGGARGDTRISGQPERRSIHACYYPSRHSSARYMDDMTTKGVIDKRTTGSHKTAQNTGASAPRHRWLPPNGNHPSAAFAAPGASPRSVDHRYVPKREERKRKRAEQVVFDEHIWLKTDRKVSDRLEPYMSYMRV